MRTDIRQKRKLRDKRRPGIQIFPSQPARQHISLAFRQACLIEFGKRLAQERADWLLFKTRIKEGGHRVEREEQDRPDHTEPAGQEGRGESWYFLFAPNLRLASEAVRLSGQN